MINSKMYFIRFKTWDINKYIALIQGAPDNSGIGRRLLDTRFKYK